VRFLHRISEVRRRSRMRVEHTTLHRHDRLRIEDNEPSVPSRARLRDRLHYLDVQTEERLLPRHHPDRMRRNDRMWLQRWMHRHLDSMRIDQRRRNMHHAEGLRVAMKLAAAALLPLSIIACADILGADFEDTKAKSGTTAAGSTKEEAEERPSPSPTEGTSSGTSSTPSTSSGGTSGGTSGGGAAKKCGGKAQACSTLDSTLCPNHKGCSWSAPKCQGLGSGCATTDPNVCFIRRPKCDFDLDARQCYPRKEWCPSAADATTCADQDGCTWTGGCAGTEAACETLSLTDCTKQRGCAVIN
jgi:hypothetical protein